jgi:hypothetical protein
MLLDELGLPIALHTAEQNAPGATLHLSAAVPSAVARRSPKRRAGTVKPVQPLLPGFADDAEPRS